MPHDTKQMGQPDLLSVLFHGDAFGMSVVFSADDISAQIYRRAVFFHDGKGTVATKLNLFGFLVEHISVFIFLRPIYIWVFN